MKVVVAAYGSRGDVEPGIAVAGELLRRGHDVCAAVTVPPELRAYVDAAGLLTVDYGRDWQELLRDNELTAMLQNPIGSIAQAAEYAARVLSEKASSLSTLAAGADLIVAGMTEQGVAANISEQQQIPLASLHFFPPQILQAGSPRAHAGTQAEGSAVRPLEIQAYDKLCLPRLADEWSGDDRRPFVGALTLEVPTGTDDEVRGWIAAGPSPVYFGFGSMPIADSADLVAVISSACQRVGVRALICLGRNDVHGTTGPEHVKVVSDVRHAEVFPACRAVVHHGGAGTTAAGLRAGVPALILWNGLDQPMWAAAVGHLGVGFGRRFSESTLDSLAADLRLVLAPHYTARSREVAGQLTPAAESLSQTVDLLEEVAGSRD